jgi:hypothetical protein
MATTPTTTTPPSTPTIYGPLNIDYLNESWCELQYKSGCSSTGSISHLNHSVNPEVLEKLLHEAQKESLSPNLTNTFPILKPFTNKENKNVTNNNVNVSSSSSDRQKCLVKNNSDKCFIPIKNANNIASTMYVYDDDSDIIDYDDDDDDDVDLEYAEDDNNNQENQELKSINQNRKNKTIQQKQKDADEDNHTLTENSNLTASKMQKKQKQGNTNDECCTTCTKHKKEINDLIQKQLSQQKELINLRNEYELKLLNKSLEVSKFCASSSPSPGSPASLSSTNSLSLSKISSGLNTPATLSNKAQETKLATELKENNCTKNVNNELGTVNIRNTNDWMKYFASRPQSQPPK